MWVPRKNKNAALFTGDHENKVTIYSLLNKFNQQNEYWDWLFLGHVLYGLSLGAVLAQWWEHWPSTNVARVWLWVEFVGSPLCSERFFHGYSGFPLSPNTYIWFDLCWFDFLSPQLEEPLCSAKCTWDMNKVIIIIMIVKTYGCHMDPYPARLGGRT